MNVLGVCVKVWNANAKTRNVKQQPWMNGIAMRFDMIGQLPLEIIGWLRDAFHLE